MSGPSGSPPVARAAGGGRLGRAGRARGAGDGPAEGLLDRGVRPLTDHIFRGHPVRKLQGF